MTNPLQSFGEQARQAAITLLSSTPEQRNQALLLMAEELRSASAAILQANAKDVADARTGNHLDAFIDRLTLNPERMELMISGVTQVASLPDPLSIVLEGWDRPNGLHIQKVPIPLGVIGFIYESRSTVTCDAAALCLKSGNAVILRGGKESRQTNEVIIRCIHAALTKAGLPAECIQLLSSGDRQEVQWMCELSGLIDVIIPRGGKGLVSAVTQYAHMPVLKHLDGICHIYVDASADTKLAVNIIDDAKTQRPGVCNAAETVLVHQAIAADILPLIAERLKSRGVELRGCKRSLPYLGEGAIPATEEDWRTEYEDLIVSIKTIDSTEEAIKHINHYGSHHSDAIITTDEAARDAFFRSVDSACVYHNCSTRFSDGQEFGFGAEIGIGTDKIHARGPMALRELTTYKYIVYGNGQVKDPSRLI